MKITGIVLIVASVIAGLALVVAGIGRPGAAIDNFARGNIGCVTVIDIDNPGRYHLFLETFDAEVGPVGGCQPEYNSTDDVEVTLVGQDGEVALGADDSLIYERSDRTGASLAAFSVDKAGEYELIAAGSNPATLVAVGPDPNAGRSLMLLLGAATTMLGIGVGMVLMARSTNRTVNAGDWAGSSSMVQLPPLPDRLPDAQAQDPTVWSRPQSPLTWLPPPPTSSPSPSVAPGEPTNPWAPPRPQDRRG